MKCTLSNYYWIMDVRVCVCCVCVCLVNNGNEDDERNEQGRNQSNRMCDGNDARGEKFARTMNRSSEESRLCRK